MTARFTVRTTTQFDRLARKLNRSTPEFAAVYAEAIRVLIVDPYNRSRAHDVKKLTGVDPSEGNFRLRLGRWRFRYSIYAQDVVLYYCGLRREETY